MTNALQHVFVHPILGEVVATGVWGWMEDQIPMF
jgi:hypothetical protein